MTDEELIQKIEKLKNLMISVSTGGPEVNKVNEEYKKVYSEVAVELSDRGLKNPNFYSDLWEWHGRWRSGDLPSYSSRRQFINDLYNSLIRELRNRAIGRPSEAPEEPTGWTKVDRTIGEVRKGLAEAQTEEQYQTVGLLCREALISLAQSVYDPNRHRSPDGVQPSSTNAKRMLDAYIATEFSGSSNENIRKHARSAIDLALELQHRRTADFRQAALCAEATSTVVNIIAIISGIRDPES